MRYDVGNVTEGLENELWRRWSDGKVGEGVVALPTSQLTAHSPTFQSLPIRHNSFSNPSVALPTLQPILQPFRCFTYVTVHSPTSQALHLIHLANRPCFICCVTPKKVYTSLPSWVSVIIVIKICHIVLKFLNITKHKNIYTPVSYSTAPTQCTIYE